MTLQPPKGATLNIHGFTSLKLIIIQFTLVNEFSTWAFLFCFVLFCFVFFCYQLIIQMDGFGDSELVFPFIGVDGGECWMWPSAVDWHPSNPVQLPLDLSYLKIRNGVSSFSD